MKHSDSLAKLAPALVAAQAELRSVSKDSTNPHFKNRYASLDAIIEAIRPVLAAHGLAVVQGGLGSGEAGPGLQVETMLLHSSGEWISGGVSMPLAKNDPQGAGGAMTYGRRYGLAALLSLATDEDDDGNAASRPSRQRAERSPAPRPEETPASRKGDGDFFGKPRGTPLGQYDDDGLKKIIAWCQAKDAEKPSDKLKETIKTARAILADRSLGTDDDARVKRMVAQEDAFQSQLDR